MTVSGTDGGPHPRSPATSSMGGDDQLLGEFLVSLGATEEDLARARAEGTLGQLGADLLLRGGELSAADLARELRSELQIVTAIWRSLGVEPAAPDARAFCPEDLEATQSLLSFDVFDPSDAEELLRVIGDSLARIADAAVSFYVQTVELELEKSGASMADMAQKSTMAAGRALELGSHLGTVFKHHMREAVGRQRVAQVNVSDRALSRVAVGFVDLVGFTPLTQQLGTRELARLVSQFERRAFETAARHDGRIVKHIGDEIMFVVPSAGAGCRLALDLVAEYRSEGVQPRGGLAFGEVLTRQGDYYGSVVNLASRLAGLAVPGEVLVDEGVPTAVRDALDFENAGRRLLKGFDSPVQVYSVSAADRSPG